MKLFFYFSIAVVFAIFAAAQNDPDIEPVIREFHIIVISILLEAFTFVMIGSLLSGIIEVFVSKETLSRFIPKNRFAAAMLAGCLGILFPVCECGIIPVVRRLTKKGVPLFAAITYMLAAPIINPVVIASTFIAYKGSDQLIPVAAGRICAGFFIPVLIGITASYLFKDEKPLEEEHEHDGSCSHCSHDHRGSVLKKVFAVFRHAADDVILVGRFLLMGAVLAGLLRSISFSSGDGTVRLMDVILGGTVQQVLGMMLLAVILSLCSEADAFFSRAFSVSVPGALGFLVLGPMFDIKLLLMYFKVFREKVILFLITSILLVNTVLWVAAALIMKVIQHG